MPEWKGLKIDKISTRVERDKEIWTVKSYAELEEKVREIFNDNGFVVAYLDYKVLIGKFDEGVFVFYDNESFEPRYLQKLRVFNEDKELLLWRQSEDLFRMRLRIDKEGKPMDYVTARQVLWGTKSEDLGGSWCRIYEERGTELILPVEDPKLVGKEGKRRVKILTYNYIDFNEVGQAGYVDCRFVRFEGGEKDE